MFNKNGNDDFDLITFTKEVKNILYKAEKLPRVFQFSDEVLYSTAIIKMGYSLFDFINPSIFQPRTIPFYEHCHSFSLKERVKAKDLVDNHQTILEWIKTHNIAVSLPLGTN